MSLGHGASIVRSELILNLDAGNIKSYPGSGTAWNDLSGGNYTSTLTNGPTFNTGNNGYFSFDGVDDYSVLNNNLLADNLSSLTVSVWAYSNWSSASYGLYSLAPIISKIGDSSNDAGWELGVGWSGQDIYFATQNSGGSSYNARSVNVPSSGSYWLNLTASYSGGVSGPIKIYFNGVEKTLVDQSVGTVSSATTTSAVTIGSRNGANTFGIKYFTGLVAQIQIYNRALSATEVSQNFNALRGRYGI